VRPSTLHTPRTRWLEIWGGSQRDPSSTCSSASLAVCTCSQQQQTTTSVFSLMTRPSFQRWRFGPPQKLLPVVRAPHLLEDRVHEGPHPLPLLPPAPVLGRRLEHQVLRALQMLPQVPHMV
jgi:hypothetical protein